MQPVNRIADVGGIHFKQQTKPTNALEQVSQDLKIQEERRKLEDLKVLEQQYENDVRVAQEKLNAVREMLGKNKPIKTTRMPHGTSKITKESIERYFRMHKGELITPQQLRDFVKEALGGFAPSDPVFYGALSDIKKRFNITATGAPQLRTYKYE